MTDTDPRLEDSSLIAATMLKAWHSGLRGEEFHLKVRAEHPDASLNAYQAAADKAWAEILAGIGGAS